ncbi:MAG: hypothetical protein ABJA02_16480 [Acidobacteriota bacterium]
MNKIAESELSRSFLIERLPEPLRYSSSHLQITDQHISRTNIRVRQVRDPRSREIAYALQKTTVITRQSTVLRKVEEIHLDESERSTLIQLPGRESRKNRYFHDLDGKMMVFDVYLGSLLGLTIAKVDFCDDREMDNFEPPPFTIYEITNDPFFTPAHLADKNYEAVAEKINSLSRLSPILHEGPDE